MPPSAPPPDSPAASAADLNRTLMATVFIGVPTFSRPRMLARALTSIAAQSYPDYTVLVSDNGADPASRAVVETRADGRFRYIPQPVNLGLVANWNFLRRAVGPQPYWALLEDDNFWAPDHLERGLAALARNPEAAMSFCAAREFWDQEGRLSEKTGRASASPGFSLEVPQSCDLDWLGGSRCPSSSVIIRASIWRNAPAFAGQLPFCHDYLQWALLGINYPVLYSEQPSVSYTCHSGNAVRTFIGSRRSGAQMREVRRLLGAELLRRRRILGRGLGKLIADRLAAGQIGQIVPAFLGAADARLIEAGRFLLHTRPDAHSVSGHMRIGSKLGAFYFRHCDFVDRLLGWMAARRRA